MMELQLEVNGGFDEYFLLLSNCAITCARDLINGKCL